MTLRKNRLGSEKIFANIPSAGGFTYTAYKECGIAALLEYGVIFLTIGGLAAIILTIMKIGPANAAIAVISLIIANILLRMLAGAVNDQLIKRKISENTEFAKYFAAAYPEHAELCEILNEEYAINSDAIPDIDFHPNRAKAQKAANVIKYIGLGILMLAGFSLYFLAKWLEKYAYEI